jgi:hypothetical protein
VQSMTAGRRKAPHGEHESVFSTSATIEVHEDLARTLSVEPGWARRFTAVVRKLESIHSQATRHRSIDRKLARSIYKTRLNRELRLVYEVVYASDGLHLRFITPVLEHGLAERLHMPRYLNALRAGVPELTRFLDADVETSDAEPEPDPTDWEVPELFRPVSSGGELAPEDWSWGEVALDPEQRALTHKPGPVFLAGAPGTGKSTVAHARMRTWQNDRDSILYVTFSERLKQRVEEDQRLAPDDGKRRDIRTFRELCLDHIALHKGASHAWTLENSRWNEDRCVSYNAFRRWWDDGAGGVKPARRSADAWREFQQTYTPALIEERARMKVNEVVGTLQRGDRDRLARHGCTELYHAFDQYRQWTDAQGTWDLATLAELAKLAGRPDAVYEQVIVDEVQDLTIQQAVFCAHFARSNAGRFFAGDEGQILYGTGFEWKSLRAAIYHLEPNAAGRRSNHVLDGLTTAYRCPAGAMAIFGQLAQARHVLDGAANPRAALPRAVRMDRRVNVFDAAGIRASGWEPGLPWSTTVAFIYYAGDCSEEEKRSEHEWLLGEDCPNLYSIEQCKGLEYETVFLLDMLVPIREALKPSQPADAAEKDNRLHLIAYMTVAVSRVLQQLVFIDTGAAALPDGDVEWHAGSAEEFLELTRQPAIRLSNVKEQLAKADELWDAQDWKGARRWYQRAGSSRVYACKAQLELSRNPRGYRSAAELFELGGEHARAAELYRLAGDDPAVFRAWLGGGTVEAWEKAYEVWAGLPTIQRRQTVDLWFEREEQVAWLHRTQRFVAVFIDKAAILRQRHQTAFNQLQTMISLLNQPPRFEDAHVDQSSP